MRFIKFTVLIACIIVSAINVATGAVMTFVDNFADTTRILDNDGIELSDGFLTIASNVLNESDNDVVACWRFDESSGNVVHDSSGSHNGTRQNMEDEDWVSGIFGNALLFDGDNESVIVPDHVNLNGFSQFTLECWLKPQNETYVDNEGLICKTGSYALYFNGTSNYPYGYVNTGGGQGISYNEQQLVTGKWHHLALTYDNDSVKLYVDGTVASQTASLSGSVVVSTATLVFGNTYGYWSGILDEVFLRNTALSSCEVSDHAKQYKPLSYVTGKLLSDEYSDVPVYSSVTVMAMGINENQKAYIRFSPDGINFYDNEGTPDNEGISLHNGTNEIPLSVNFADDGFYYRIIFENNTLGQAENRPAIDSISLEYVYEDGYYVDSTGGSDTTGDGSSLNPWKTISHAISSIQASSSFPKKIYVQAGMYQENVVMKKHIMLLGGYDANWNRNICYNNTIIDADNSGVVLKVASNTVVDGFTITGGNSSLGSGISIIGIDGPVIVSNCSIEYNESSWIGAGIAIFETAASVTISNCLIEYNTSISSGAGVSVRANTSDVAIENCIIRYNEAYFGGGICIQSASNTVFVRECAIEYNLAHLLGGAIYADSQNSSNILEIIDTNIFYNSSNYYGGAIYNYHMSLVINNSDITYNKAAEVGAGLYIKPNGTENIIEIDIIDSNISYNAIFPYDNDSQYALGGGFFLTCSGNITGTITNCKITENTVTSLPSSVLVGGAGLWMSSPQISLSECTIESNKITSNTTTVTPRGAGVYISGNKENILNNCMINNNIIISTVDNDGCAYGSGIYASRLNMRGCIIYNNTIEADCESSGAAIYLTNHSYSKRITNCTIYGNYSPDNDGGIFNTSTTAIYVENSIVRNNGNNFNGPKHLSYSCLEYQDDDTGIGVIYNDPLFEDANTGNLHLRANSPCINAGDNSAVAGLLSVDIDGEPRINQIDNESIVDIGADEFFSLDYYVSTDGFDSGSRSGSSNEPWRTIGYAIQQIPKISERHKTIHVQAGTYQERIVIDQHINLQGGYSALWIYDPSENETIIDAENSGRAIWVKGNSTIDGITIQNGNSDLGAGVRISDIDKPVTLSNCIIKNCVSSWRGGGIAVYHTDAQVDIINCDIRNNTSKSGAGIFVSSNRQPVTIEACKVRENSYSAGSGWGAGVSIDLSKAPVSINNTIIEYNNIDVGNSAGGGLHVSHSEEMVSCDKTVIKNNSAAAQGGGVYVYASNIVLTSCTIDSNHTGLTGGGGYFNGGVNMVDGICSLSNCIINGNNVMTPTTANIYGGGLFFTNNYNVEISNCEITNNSITSSGSVYGGGIRAACLIEMTNSLVASNNCTSTGYSDTAQGGGISIAFNHDYIIKNSVLRNNHCASSYNAYGGGISASCIKLIGCIVDSNSVEGGNESKGGGIDLQNTSYDKKIVNCTVYGNVSSTNNDGGIVNRGSVYAEVTNCIVWNNENDLEGNINLSYSCVKDNDSGTEVIHLDPMFENVNENDFHLTYLSPCINAGYNDAIVDYLSTDIDNEPRIWNSTCDIGADEFVDTDGDGLSDHAEINIHKTNPASSDTDGDGIDDYQEVMIPYYNPHVANIPVEYTDTTTSPNISIECYRLNGGNLLIKGTSSNERPIKFHFGATDNRNTTFINTYDDFVYNVQEVDCTVVNEYLHVTFVAIDGGAAFSPATADYEIIGDTQNKILAPPNGATISIKGVQQ
ncbi:MAG: right-handed parallel beta-helix repeat-containing protein [Candidatus Auribacterota bacterium]|nr:right-handed parallel beta-helix repeat-containing protein [Candidatus Auribacterota bacterium]